VSRLSLTVALCAVAGLAGCGGSSSSSGNSAKIAEARFVALSNAICSEAKTHKATDAAFEAHLRDELATLEPLANTAHELPRFREYLSDVAARRKLLAKLAVPSNLPSFKAQGSLTSPVELLQQTYRLDTKVYEDKKALGLTSCTGSRPRPPIGG
jgi:hypothetical protein